MTKKAEPQNPNEITRIEKNRLGEDEEVTYQLGMVIKRVKVAKKEVIKKVSKKEQEKEND